MAQDQITRSAQGSCALVKRKSFIPWGKKNCFLTNEISWTFATKSVDLPFTKSTILTWIFFTKIKNWIKTIFITF